MELIIRSVGIVLLTLCTYVIIPAIKDWRRSKLSQAQREELTFWVETGVLWAKQWLQSATGEEKKMKVMLWVKAKVDELGLPYSDDDIDKAIEAVYNTVKDVTDAAAGHGCAADPAVAE